MSNLQAYLDELAESAINGNYFHVYTALRQDCATQPDQLVYRTCNLCQLLVDLGYALTAQTLLEKFNELGE